ncbi:hypothetical protein JVU11DRAFT_3026 [Chiua virens]|nr:hypothetical protein JVU11DRAFT_3026 [Chiua virens]
MGTPFDLGAQRFEYPFPQTQGSPTDPFLPLSSSITPHSHSHAQLPPWPIHISKSFPLTPPPLGKFKAHPKLRPSSVREPPVPPGLVKRRSRIAEESSDRTDPGDPVSNAKKSPRTTSTFTKLSPRHPIQLSSSEILPVKQATSLPTGSFDRPTIENPAGLVIDAPSAEGPPRTPAVSPSA